MTQVNERSTHGLDMQGSSHAGRTPSRRIVVVGLVVIALVAVSVWAWRELTSHPSVYVVGDSITALSANALNATLSSAGYDPTITATPGVKIGQALEDVTNLARQEPAAWIVELGTNDAGAHDDTWIEPFLAEWKAVSAAHCVIYVTVSPQAGPVAAQVNTSIEKLAKGHPNVHVLDWGQAEYSTPGWVSADDIHPTPAGQSALAQFEAQELTRAC